ncbi:MAG: CHAT domain-containing protein [Bacteroidetes bacterium]|nr:CHAT domain-containing protein [Bacteroidota bacterium]
MQVGNFNKAKELRENNVSLWEEKANKPKSILYLSFLLFATSSEIISGNFDKAEEYLVKAKPLAEKRNEKSIYLVYLLLKGHYCNQAAIIGNGNKELIDSSWFDRINSFFIEKSSLNEVFKREAEKCFIEYVETEKSSNGDESLRYAKALYALANFYITHGMHKEAIMHLHKAKLICEKYKANAINLYYSVISALSISEFALNGYEHVKKNLDALEKYHFNKQIANYAFLTEKEKEAYKNIIDRNITAINSIYIAATSNETRIKLYNNIIATKEIALYATENTRNFLEKMNDSLKQEYYEVIKQRDSLETAKNVAFNSNSKGGNEILLREKKVQTKINSLPGIIPFDPTAIKFTNISTALKKNEVAIEFIHCIIENSEQYFALLIKNDSQAPELIPLFEESVLRKILNQPGNAEAKINNIYSKNIDSLYSLIWKPIEKNLFNIDKAYISVSGILYGISFPALLDGNKIDAVLLGSTRQIGMKSDDKRQIYSPAILFGGLNYGQGGHPNRSASGKANFSELRYTINEVTSIKNMLDSKHSDIKVTLFTKDSGNEESFRQLQSLQPSLIHLATHGYYYPTRNINLSNFDVGINSETNLDPMIRSGIVFSGANNASSAYSENDGFLTAQEIARLNFSNLDLVVLSACETGLGEINGSEGVFGLQRAFKLAGARSLLMSLWSVPDKQTAELMSLFYSNYLQGISKSRALKNAQVDMRKKYKNPFYWGGFILLER